MPSCCPRVVMATFTMSFHLLLATLLIGGGMSAASDDQRETKPCPSNGEWISVNRTECVRVHEGDPLTWEEAQEVCRKDGGGHLLFNIDLIFQVFDSTYLTTWQAAREFCQQLGNNGDLAVFEEWTTFFDVIGSGTESSWIGQYWDVEAGGWVWVDGTAPTWAEWDGVSVPADPVVNERLGCVAVKNEFSYAVHYQANCNAYKPPVCRMDPNTAGQSSITYPTVAPVPKCGGSFSEWYAFGSKCVMPFREDKKSWHDARLHCHELGGDLVSIHSSEEMAFVESIYAIGGELPSLEPDVYIGLRRDEKNPDSDNFLWSDGSAFDYENWTPGEPSNFENQESCVQFYAKGGTWNDFNCAAGFAYVCQVSACEPACSSVTPVPTTPLPTLSCEDGWEPMGKSAAIDPSSSMRAAA